MPSRDTLPDGRTVQEFVDAHPGGATQEEVAEALGLPRPQVAHIEAVALRKMREALEG